MVYRDRHVLTIKEKLEIFPVVGIVGPRQVGKTTLAGQVGKSFDGDVRLFDLESDSDLNRLGDDPEFVLSECNGLVILDEVQRRPELFPTLRVLADRYEDRLRFLVLGSAAPNLLKQSSETLAGRISYHYLNGLGLDELPSDTFNRRWLRGGFPRAFLARTNGLAETWLAGFIQTFLNRDIPSLGLNIPANTLRRFWTMLAHLHGNQWNAAEIGRSFSLSDTTVQRYLDFFCDALVMRQLRPWFANIGKRQVKSPRPYFRDSGLLHSLLHIHDMESLYSHPKCGASWEGYILDLLQSLLGLEDHEMYFWRTHQGAEIDLILQLGSTTVGIEIKRTTLPKLTRSIYHALDDLKLSEVVIIHAGRESFRLNPKVRTVAARNLLTDLAL